MSTLTAIIADPYASEVMSREEEIAMHVEKFTELVGPLDWYDVEIFREDAIKPGTKLVLFDYGGMSLGNDLLFDNSRRLVRWAEDHPNALVIVVSAFTYRAVCDELMDAGYADPRGISLVCKDSEEKIPAERLPNVIGVSYASELVIPDWWKEKHGHHRRTARRSRKPRRAAKR